MSENDDDEATKLTQASPDVEAMLTQPQLDKEKQSAALIMSAEMERQYQEERSNILEDGLILEEKGNCRPLSFFRLSQDSLDISVGRGEDVDVDLVVPIKSGWCGVSRLAFRLMRSAEGDYSILPFNRVAFFIQGSDRCQRVKPYAEDEQPKPIALNPKDRMVFNACSLFIHQGKQTVNNLAVDVVNRIPRSTDYLLEEAVRGLIFIRKSSDKQTLEEVLPSIVANLTGLISHVGDKRSLPFTYHESRNEGHRSGGNYVSGQRGRGSGRSRARVHF